MEVRPQIAYQGPPPVDNAYDRTVTHPFYTWWEVREGRARITTAGGEWTATKGQWILIPHGMQRHQLIDAGTDLSSLNFRAVWANGKPVLELDEPLLGSVREGFVGSARVVCQIGGRHREAAGRWLRDGDIEMDQWIEMQSALLAFVVGLIRHACLQGGRVTAAFSGDVRLDQLLESLRHEVRAGPLPYAAWGRKFGLGRAQLDRLARQHFGSTVRVLRDCILLEEIRRELSTGTLSGKELTNKYGFSDAAHFTRWVRAMTGRTPRELRRSAV